MMTTTHLARMREVLVEAIDANERQAETLTPGPEADAHRAARTSLEQALGRLDDGSYGTCVTCGAALPIERLELVPDAERCMPCIQRPPSLYG
ncbi:MAG TPA: TraR/DksA C4-type zinc finger protein [Iamia sp.]|nr:TraR/DksA C4-type zinc finger protein [Iamia sp.]